MLTREMVRELALEGKDRLGLTWPQLGEAIGRDPVYAAMLVYGYGQADEREADELVRALALPEGAKAALMKAPSREPAQPWPPTDPSTRSSYTTAPCSRTWPMSCSATAS